MGDCGRRGQWVAVKEYESISESKIDMEKARVMDTVKSLPSIKP